MMNREFSIELKREKLGRTINLVNYFELILKVFSGKLGEIRTIVLHENIPYLTATLFKIVQLKKKKHNIQ